ncbi:hypothetical protein L9W77_04570 [Vibrio aestuarianus]|nr:hypothetical protein [Vibrio aestuarianus]
MREQFTEKMIQKSIALLEVKPELFEQFMAFSARKNAEDDKVYIQDLFRFFYEQDVIRPELILDKTHVLGRNLLASIEQFNLFKAALIGYQNAEQIGLYLAQYDLGLSDWIFNTDAQAMKLNPDRQNDLNLGLLNNNVVIGTDIDISLLDPFSNSDPFLAQFNDRPLPTCDFSSFYPAEWNDGVLSLSAVADLAWKGEETPVHISKQLQAYRQRQTQLVELDKKIKQLAQPVCCSHYYQEGKSRPFAMPELIGSIDHIVLDKIPSSDELLNALLACQSKHISAFSYTDQGLANLKKAVTVIERDQLFDVNAVTFSKKIDQRVIDAVYTPEKPPLKEEPSCVFDLDREYQNELDKIREEIAHIKQNKLAAQPNQTYPRVKP